MSTTAYDHHNIDCSQSSFFSVRSSTYRPLRTAILVSNVLRGRVSGFIAVGGGEGPHLAKRKANQLDTHTQATILDKKC